MMFYVVDCDIHYDLNVIFKTIDEALAEIRRRAALPFEHVDNEPCSLTCAREYCIYECEEGREHYFEEWRRKVHVCTISAEGLVWEKGFEAELARWLIEP